MDTKEYPSISTIFFILAGLSFLGGIVLCLKLSPGEPEYGYTWKTTAYIPSMVAFVSGFVQAAFLSAIGQGLYYLNRIAENTSSGAKRHFVETPDIPRKPTPRTNQSAPVLTSKLSATATQLDALSLKLSNIGYKLEGSDNNWKITKGTFCEHYYNLEELIERSDKLAKYADGLI